MNYKTIQSARQIELDNYLRALMELSRERPEILYRAIELAKKDNEKEVKK